MSYPRVHGAEVLAEWTRKNGVRVSSLLKVGVAFTAAGDTIVDRIRVTSFLRDGPLGIEEHRTLFTVAASNAFGAVVRYHPADERTRQYGNVLQVRGASFLLTDLAGGQHSGPAPPGVLPPSLLDVAVAGYEGSCRTR